MRNIKFNEAETVFETFYDGGDSYPDHQKYSCLSEYQIESDGAGRVKQGWASVNVSLFGRRDGRLGKLSMERACSLDIQGYDVFRLFAAISSKITFKIICCIDGVDTPVIVSAGDDITKEYNGTLSGNLITKIRLEFQSVSAEDVVAEMRWMGLSNREKEAEMLARKSPYTAEWEGCFAAEPVFEPQNGIYFDKAELGEIRERVQTKEFKTLMDILRKEAEEAMLIEPEQEIGDYVHNSDRRFVRERDMGRPNLADKMKTLAFVGLVDRDPEMLRMSCRMALSVASCTYFSEGFMGVVPGVAWHMRSFREEKICTALVKVLDWAGGLLTWHGKNIIYDAIIMKGLPRLDADLKTMDYIWKMNQGVAFASGLVEILLALQKRYPRYSVRVEEAEENFLAMWENYIQVDGGTSEGPAYWNYTMIHVVEAMYLLARYHEKPIEEYVPKSMYASAEFACAVLSDAGNFWVPVNDASPGGKYNPKAVNFLAKINAGERWKVENNRFLEAPWMKAETRGCILNMLIYGRKYETEGLSESKDFLNMPITGHTTLRRKTDDLGVVGLHTVSGVITFGHGHEDKGSFVLEADGKQLLIDRGACSYINAYIYVIKNAELHNVLTLVRNGRHLSQNKDNPACGGIVTQAEYVNGVFTYSTDVTPCWDGAFQKNIRSVQSPDPYHYVIEDHAIVDPSDEVCFILNTYGTVTEAEGEWQIEDAGVRIRVAPKNWKPDRAEYGVHGTDGKYRTVSRLCLYKGGSREHCLITELILEKYA